MLQIMEIQKPIIENGHNIYFEKNNLNIIKSIKEAFIVFTTFGVSAYEIASLEKRSIIYCTNKNDLVSASIFKRKKISLVINNLQDLIEEEVINFYEASRCKYREKLISKKLKNGAKNIASKIYKLNYVN